MSRGMIKKLNLLQKAWRCSWHIWALMHLTLAGTHSINWRAVYALLSGVSLGQASLAAGLGCVSARPAARRVLPLQGMWLQAVNFHWSHWAMIPVKPWTSGVFPQQAGCDRWKASKLAAVAGPNGNCGHSLFSEWKTVTLEVKSCWNEKRTFIIALQAAIWLFLLLFLEPGRMLTAFTISLCSPVELGCNKNKNLPVTPEHFSRLLFPL